MNTRIILNCVSSEGTIITFDVKQYINIFINNRHYTPFFVSINSESSLGIVTIRLRFNFLLAFFY